MPIPQYHADAFLAASKRTLPKGRAWPRGLGSVLSQVIASFMPAAENFGKAAAGLPAGSFPGTTIAMLPDWEKSLGLPDPCAGESPTELQRRSQVIARLTDSGGSSIAYFTAFAKTLGYDITIKEYIPACADLMCAEDPVYGEDWAFCWLVSSPGFTPIYFLADQSSAEDPLMTWGNAVLCCEFETRNPAHLILRFAQNGQNIINDFGGDFQTMITSQGD